MGTLYKHYLTAFWNSLIVTEVGEGTYTVPSRSEPDRLHFVTYDGKGFPVCKCKAAQCGKHCAHRAAVMAYCSPPLQRQWDEKRIREFNESRLDIITGRVNPRRNRRIKAEMDRIQAELDAKFNVELEQETADEAMRLSLGMGE